VIASAQRYSPHAATNINDWITTSPFRTIGRPISHSARQWPAPSILADSNISCGTNWNMLRMIRMLIASLQRNIGQYEAARIVDEAKPVLRLVDG